MKRVQIYLFVFIMDLIFVSQLYGAKVELGSLERRLDSEAYSLKTTLRF